MNDIAIDQLKRNLTQAETVLTAYKQQYTQLTETLAQAFSREVTWLEQEKGPGYELDPSEVAPWGELHAKFKKQTEFVRTLRALLQVAVLADLDTTSPV